ncbi:uncharacterized protein LOC134540887 [Bacillus rossius redtenbacheri]|uniref:uncharacterized protein LOC134540887 n=2 Tax=Bacillus rossius redtenbacheri TaxID=93214 RepID=UPI002FDE353B
MEKWLGLRQNSDQEPSCSSQSAEIRLHECNPDASLDIIAESEEKQSHCVLKNPRKKLKISGKIKRTNKFCDSWLQIPELKSWLQKSNKTSLGNELAYCTVCRVDITAHKNDITRHSNSSKHQLNWQQVSTSHKLTSLKFITSDEVKRAEIKLAGLIASNNLPFSLVDTLVPLCADIFPDSKIAKNVTLGRTKATAVVKDVLGPAFQSKLHKHLAEAGTFLSIIMDETTDMSSVKQCAFAVVYYNNETHSVVTSFLDMVSVTSSAATDLFECLKNCLHLKNIPLSNIVGFSADTTNVMVGEHHSVFSLLKENVPGIVCIKCSCHMIHLAASKACLVLPRSVEDLLRNLGAHFSRSYIRREKLREFQIFFQTEIHNILSPAVTRWLSLKACIDRVLEQYLALESYLRESVFEDPSRTTEDMLKTMENKYTKMYMEFMSYVLGLLTNFNTLFQGEMPLLHRLKSEVERLLKTLCCNFMSPSYVKGMDVLTIEHKNPSNYVALNKVYLEILAQSSLDKLTEDKNVRENDLQFFLKSCLQFYVELVSQIKSRFDFSDKVFDVVNIVEPCVAQSLEIPSIMPVLKRFPILNDHVSAQAVDHEWRQHAMLDHAKLGLDSSKPAEEYWKDVFNLKNAAGAKLFENLEKVLGLLLVLPFSNACVERLFSTLRNIKTYHRNKLSNDTLVALISSKEGIEAEGGCVSFNPSKTMVNTKLWN